jgi:hypothetical protein
MKLRNEKAMSVWLLRLEIFQKIEVTESQLKYKDR